MRDAICERPPTSPLILERVIEPYAGRVPGTKEAMIFDVPVKDSVKFYAPKEMLLTQSDKLSVWTDFMSEFHTILFCCNDTVQKTGE